MENKLILRRYYLLTFCLIISLINGCTKAKPDHVYQISTIDALLTGIYDGHISCSDLSNEGDFGIGTYDRLDGEMILLDDVFYQVRSDGKIYRPDSSATTPFATVCSFDCTDNQIINSPANLDEIKSLLNGDITNSNLFYAIKIEGTFSQVHTRSVPRQKPPFRPLQEITANQPEFYSEIISGTIVGFKCPEYVKGINVPGYHLHFISDDKSFGGHLLNCEIQNGSYCIQKLDKFTLMLPTESNSFKDTDLSMDRSSELEEVEK